MADSWRKPVSPQSVHAAAGNAEFLTAVRDLLEAAEAEGARGGFGCRSCGTCCDFAKAGHMLFATPGELALLLSQPRTVPHAALNHARRDEADSDCGRADDLASRPAGGLPCGVVRQAGVCPFRAGAKCSARPARCLGCRLYFCAPGADEAFQRLYEEYHRRLGELHRRHGVPYEYGELTASLAACGRGHRQ
jgi:Fe-S-cluster containining protein